MIWIPGADELCLSGQYFKWSPQPPIYAFNFCRLEVQLYTGWMDGHPIPSSNIPTTKLPAELFQSQKELEWFCLNFTSLIRKGQVCIQVHK